MTCAHDCITYQATCAARKCRAVVLRSTCEASRAVLCEDCESVAVRRDEAAGEQMVMEGLE